MHGDVELLEMGFAELDARAEEDRRARTRLRWALYGAIGVHGVLFAVHWPAVSAEPLPEVQQRKPVVARVERYAFTRPEERLRQKPRGPGQRRPPSPPEPLEREAAVPDNKPLDDVELLWREVPPPPGWTPPDAVTRIVEPSRRFIRGPVRVSGPDPAYPRPALVARVEGVVILECAIDRDGRVEDVKILRPGHLGMSEAAVEAVRQWRFEPCGVDDRPVEARFVLRVRFVIPE